MKTLDEAIKTLRAKQIEAIAHAVDNADGPEHIDDLAFVSLLLTDLIELHQDTPVGWSIVTAHRALIKMAQNEWVIGRQPRQLHHARQPSGSMVWKERCENLQQALDSKRQEYDREVYALRLEISELNQAFDAMSTGRRIGPGPPPTRIPGPGVLPVHRAPGAWSRIIRWLRGAR